MKKSLLLVLIAYIIMAYLSACGSQSRQLADIPLPFNADGFFIMNLPTSNGNGGLGSFSFGGHEEWYTRGTLWDAFYKAVNFDSYVAYFNSLMNSITPTLVDAVTVCTISTDDWLQNPFRILAREDPLYFWARNDPYNQGIGVRMTVYQMRGYGYLFFSLSFWDWDESYDRRFRIEDSIHHSLYRISPCDLVRFSEFAERLERGRVVFHGHTTFTRSFKRGVTIVGIVGLLVAILGVVIILKYRSAVHIADLDALSEEERNKHDAVDLRRCYAKIICIPVGLLATICASYWRFSMSGLMLTRVSFESLFWVTGLCAVAAVGLVLFAGIYVNVSKRFKR